MSSTAAFRLHCFTQQPLVMNLVMKKGWLWCAGLGVYLLRDALKG